MKLNLQNLYAQTGLLLDVATRTAEGIRAATAAARTTAEGWTSEATNRHMPTATNDTAAVAAELEAARLLKVR